MQNNNPDQTLFTYQKHGGYFAVVAEGLEKDCARELSDFGAREVKTTYRGLRFHADLATVYKVNYCSRLCTRVLAPLITFDCHSTKYLYKTARNIPWTTLLRKNGSFAVSATTAHSKIRHSKYAALCLKDAIVDAFREEFGVRPDVDRRNPELWLHLHVENNRATISLDTSGGSLHRRGYRIETVEAPMQETLAAAIIRLSGWRGERPLVDPMCGSGTLLAEAYMHYCRVPPGFLRKKFGFEMMPDFSPKEWKTVRDSVDSGRIEMAPGLISGSDISAEAVKAAKKNISALPGGKGISIKRSPFQKLGSLENRVIISNPPYGIRLGKKDQAGTLLKEFGNFLKKKCEGSDAFLYFGRKEMLKLVGLKPAWKKQIKSGGLEGVLVKYSIY